MYKGRNDLKGDVNCPSGRSCLIWITIHVLGNQYKTLNFFR